MALAVLDTLKAVTRNALEQLPLSAADFCLAQFVVWPSFSVMAVVKLVFIFRHVRKIAESDYFVSIRLSVRMEQLVSHRTDFHEISYLSIFRKSVQKIQVSLKSDKNNRYFT